MPGVLSIGPLLVPVIRLALVLALALAGWWAVRRARAGSLDESWVSSVASGVGWAGILGARLGFVIANLDAYRTAPLEALYLWQPGYLPEAGVAAGAVYALWRLRGRPPGARFAYAGSLASGFGLGAALFGLAYGATTAGPVGATTLRVGDTAPEVRMVNLEGRPVSLSALRGRAVALNFWATWCPPCVREMPLLESVQAEYRDRGLTVVGIDLDEPVARVAPVVQRRGVTYPVWVDEPGVPSASRAAYAQFGGVGLPTTIFIDAAGVVRSTQVGELNRGVLVSKVRAILPSR